MAKPIITLTTDFGSRDSYVAEMKGVILDICSNATIVDVSHEIQKFSIRMGAYVLACAALCFPKGAVHVAVVDPGVGTKRKPVVIQTKKAILIGPDNGVLALAAKNQEIQSAHEIVNPKFMRTDVSTTFHGRDVFAPVAAHVAKGVPLKEVGPEVNSIVVPEFAKIAKDKDKMTGEVLHIDDFGNVITNFSEEELEALAIKETAEMMLQSIKVKLMVCRAYENVETMRPLAMLGSHDFLEISINQGNAAKYFKLKVGDKIELNHS